MNKIINITVNDKIAVANDVLYICGNSDFIVNFDFDDEWNEFDTKTARFLHGGQYTDVVFQGSQCGVPIISNTHKIYVGVFAGNLRTTTPAIIMAKKSILCGSGSPAAPSDDVYNQIMDLIKSLGEVDPEVIESAVKEYMQENPVEVEVTDEQIAAVVETYLNENPIEVESDFLPLPSTATIGQYFRVKSVDESGKVTEVEAVDVESGGGSSGEWKTAMEYAAIAEDIGTLTVEVPDATEIEIYINGRAQDAADSQANGTTDFDIKVNNVKLGRFSMYVRPSGAAFKRYIKLEAANNEVVTIKAEQSASSYASFANVLRNSGAAVTGAISTITIYPVTSGMLLKTGTLIGIRYR